MLCVLWKLLKPQARMVSSPDGFQPFFFKRYWNILGDDVWRLVKNAFEIGMVDKRILDTLLVLVPKTENPCQFSQFRPISLRNVLYKLISKVLVNRIRPLLSDLVGPFQSSFIPGRGTCDNAIIA